MRRLYEWILRLAGSPRALPALFGLSFAESMIFPIPPDVMLVPMCVARPKSALRYAFWCSVASLLGGMAGYAIGHFAWEAVSDWFFTYVPGVTDDGFGRVQVLYDEWNFWVVFTAGFTPIPYKLITITAGVFEIAFPTFVVASAISRSARFFLVALMLRTWGEAAQEFIERRFNLVATIFVILLVGGFIVASRL